jgi:indolepyruvate ferredoxin oxidoreductase
VQIVLPEFVMPPGGVHIRWPDTALEQEARLFDYKWYAALAYIRANKLNHNVIQGPNDRFGLIASGKAFNDTRQALLDLGLDDATCQRLGIRVHKVGVVWPLESNTTREFATGLREILVVEEKRQVIEYQLKEELYNWRDDVRPTIVGKFDETDGDTSGGEWSIPNPTERTLLRANADLTPAIIARAIAKRLKKLGIDADATARIDAHLAILEGKDALMKTRSPGAVAERQPWFCSGCPHNTSTKVPEGSRAMAGIGCHFMTIWMDRSTTGFTQMGGEGVPWSGQQPFCTDQHIFANIGDGTYFHSGILAVRQSVASGVNITYKILYNDAVAMTGGQPVGERAEGHSVVQIAMSMKAEGAQRIVVVTDEPDKYDGVALVEGVRVFHRDELDRIQREMREIKGTTIIIYDQTCATEKRRRRKRGTLVDPAVRVMINEEVCEGCGDCGVQSNCLSVEPLETPLGRKRTINQSTCNKDTSCLKGFCPSFVTVEGGTFKKKATATRAAPDPASLGALPEPKLPLINQPWGMVVAGVGGTGVITIGQLLGMAAHIEGKGIVTQDSAGLAQKGGATWSHILVANTQDEIRTTRVSMAAADLIIGCDPIVSASKETTVRMRAGRTHVALNSNSTPTAAFVKNGNWQNPADQCVAEITAQVGVSGVGAFDADALAKQLMGDTIYVNPMLLGYAWQMGWVPLHRESLVRAIELNDVQVKNNLAAFEWGRHAAHQIDALMQTLQPVQVIQFKKRESLDDLITDRMARLTDYQDAAYAQLYQNIVGRVQTTEAPLGKTLLSETVARQLYRLMAYKDEYEVARLHTQTGFMERLQNSFEGDFKVHYHLAPPLWSKRNSQGELVKRKFGPVMLTGFKLLAKLKGLRGTKLDFFGKTEERQTERTLIREYMAHIERNLTQLSEQTHAHAVKVAQVPENIKGYGHVKERNIRAARSLWASLDQP